MTALVSFDRVFEVIDLKPLIEDRRTRYRSCWPRRATDRPAPPG